MLPSKYEVLAGHDFSCFWVLKRHGKSTKSGTFAARGPDFPDFGRIFERSDFGLNFRLSKSLPKIRHFVVRGQILGESLVEMDRVGG